MTNQQVLGVLDLIIKILFANIIVSFILMFVLIGVAIYKLSNQ